MDLGLDHSVNCASSISKDLVVTFVHVADLKNVQWNVKFRFFGVFTSYRGNIDGK